MFSELAITLADGTVWLSIAEALLVGAVCLLIGVWITRFVGLLGNDAPAGEFIGVGLSAGLLVSTSWWAAVASGGRSSFTPVAIGFVVAIGLAAVRRWRTAEKPVSEVALDPAPEASLADGAVTGRRRHSVTAIVGAAIVIVALALLYGSTLIQGARDGVQPLEFMDSAYYSVLGRDLARTGVETIYSPSGFEPIDGMAVQAWYHWGEAWLAAAVIAIFGTTPLDARHLIVLPLLVLAAAAMTGTLVRRLTGTTSRGGYLFGFAACLFLAPIPLLAGPNFSSWAVGLVFGITLYGLAAIAVLLAMYGLAVVGARRDSWALAVFAGSTAAMILPAHVVIAVLAIVGIGAVWAARIGRSLLTIHRLPPVSRVWRRTIAATAVMLGATVAWSIGSGHELVANTLSPGVSPFNESWRASIAIVALGAGAFFAIPIAWIAARKRWTAETALFLGTTAIVLVGAVIWGARLGDFNTFHVFFGAVAVFATPAAAVAVWSLWRRLRVSGRRSLALVVIAFCLIQLEVSASRTFVRLGELGPGTYAPVPVSILEAIRALPPGAKVAYACLPGEEISFWDPRLLSLDARTDRRVVPMCFQSDFFGQMIGGTPMPEVAGPLFGMAPQHSLYARSDSHPGAAEVGAFLSAFDIGYLFVDGLHPNTLLPGGTVVAESGDTKLIRVR